MSTPMYDLPEHLVVGVTAEGEGPADEADLHHYVCWCGDPKCWWNVALAFNRGDK